MKCLKHHPVWKVTLEKTGVSLKCFIVMCWHPTALCFLLFLHSAMSSHLCDSCQTSLFQGYVTCFAYDLYYLWPGVKAHHTLILLDLPRGLGLHYNRTVLRPLWSISTVDCSQDVNATVLCCVPKAVNQMKTDRGNGPACHLGWCEHPVLTPDNVLKRGHLWAYQVWIGWLGVQLHLTLVSHQGQSAEGEV